ncbi:type I-G CRISPR-associated protein, Cas3-extension family [Azotobacter chroococcum]|uniref:type I-G CRISPR-associated protein, Cas3-extension family n=1 Tax=Azotobacter chroococcum TaxID=353 RepID=UPI00058A4D86|nr:hypothetical protein [Azotobacter chroococcum]
MIQTFPESDCLELTGLHIASPQGFLAALGLLRLCTQDLGLNVRLSWSGSHARLHGIDWPVLRTGMVRHMRGRSEAPEFTFPVTLENGSQAPVGRLNRIRPEDYRAAARSMRGNPRALAFLSAFATDAVVSRQGYAVCNRLDFSTGQQQFMPKLRHLADELDPTREDFETRLRHALFGGPYEAQHSFGWDPVAVRRHAHEAEAPTHSAPPSQPFCIWLAIESLPLHPVLPIGPDRAVTTGFSGEQYLWPQWSEPLTLEEVRLLRQRPISTLEKLEGVLAIWRSAIASSGRYDTLSTAVRSPGYRPIPWGFGRDGSTQAKC